MKNRIVGGLLFAILAMFLVTCTTDEGLISPLNDDFQVEERSPVVPFKGVYTTYPVPNFTLEEPLCLEDIPDIFIDANGNATHLGNSTWYSEAKIYGEVQKGCQTFTAADGSTLSGEYCGGFEYFVGPYYIIGGGNYILTEGTGRFENATGCGTYSVYVNYPNELGELIGHLEFEGELDKNGNTLECEEPCPF